jgi:hypothetical protein
LPNNNQSPSIVIAGSGGNPSTQTEVNIPIAAAGALLDGPTAGLSYNLKLTSDVAAMPFIERSDLWIRELKLQSGGVELERWQKHAQMLARVIDGSMSYDYARAQYDYLGDIRNKLSFRYTNATDSANTVIRGGLVRTLAQEATVLYSDIAATGGRQFYLHLFHLGFFQQRAYYPLMLAPLELVITSETNIGSVLCQGVVNAFSGAPSSGAAFAAGTALTVSNIYITAVCPVPTAPLAKAYIEMQASGDTPFIMPINVYDIQQRAAAFSSDGTETQLVFNVNRQNVQDCYFWCQRQASLTVPIFYKTAAPFHNPSNVRLDLAGRIVPNQYLLNDVDTYNALCEAFNCEDSVAHPNLISRGAYRSRLDTSNLVTDGGADIPVTLTAFDVGRFQLGFNFEQYLGEQGSRTGLNLLAAGNAVQLLGTFGYSVNTDMTWQCMTRYLRVLVLRGAILSVLMG